MPRLMAFDYGSKRIGVAVTDSLQIIATSLTTIHPKDAIDYIKKYLVSEEVAAFILGEPKQMDGSASQSAQQVKGFATLLKKNFADIPIEMIDERFTSKMASAAIAQSGLKKSDRQKKELVDAVAAVIILQSYLEKKSLGF
jgi:putative Holliday junction resolvase